MGRVVGVAGVGWGEAGGAGGLRTVRKGLEDALNYRLIISGD